ncbi:hypothetical protein JXB01_01440 [Candidatus Micrarchaeota archaeon]|nr:hypothetical protein [Candidatus Micrarchaeota archaeon]
MSPVLKEAKNEEMKIVPKKVSPFEVSLTKYINKLGLPLKNICLDGLNDFKKTNPKSLVGFNNFVKKVAGNKKWSSTFKTLVLKANFENMFIASEKKHNDFMKFFSATMLKNLKPAEQESYVNFAAAFVNNKNHAGMEESSIMVLNALLRDKKLNSFMKSGIMDQWSALLKNPSFSNAQFKTVFNAWAGTKDLNAFYTALTDAEKSLTKVAASKM